MVLLRIAKCTMSAIAATLPNSRETHRRVDDAPDSTLVHDLLLTQATASGPPPADARTARSRRRPAPVDDVLVDLLRLPDRQTGRPNSIRVVQLGCHLAVSLQRCRPTLRLCELARRVAPLAATSGRLKRALCTSSVRLNSAYNSPAHSSVASMQQTTSPYVENIRPPDKTVNKFSQTRMSIKVDTSTAKTPRTAGPCGAGVLGSL